MAEVKLCGYTVLVDDEDYERVLALRWHINKGRNRGNYFEYGMWDPRLKRPVCISLHRFIMGCYS